MIDGHAGHDLRNAAIPRNGRRRQNLLLAGNKMAQTRAILFHAAGAPGQLRLLAGFSACRSIGSTITLVPTLTRE